MFKMNTIPHSRIMELLSPLSIKTKSSAADNIAQDTNRNTNHVLHVAGSIGTLDIGNDMMTMLALENGGRWLVIRKWLDRIVYRRLDNENKVSREKIDKFNSIDRRPDEG